MGLNIRFWLLAIGNGLLDIGYWQWGFRNRVQRYYLKLTKLVISSKKKQKNAQKYLVIQKKAVTLQRNLRKNFQIVFRRYT